MNINRKETVFKKNIIRRNLLNHNFRNVELSDDISNIFYELVNGKIICTYIPISSEINVLPALSSSIFLNTTFVDGENLQICTYSEPFIENKFGVLQPKILTPNFDTEVFIVPGVGFTKFGDRLGRGGGYYDALLKENSEALKIGICHDFQLVDQLPIEEHDIAMDYVFTDKNYYKSSI